MQHPLATDKREPVVLRPQAATAPYSSLTQTSLTTEQHHLDMYSPETPSLILLSSRILLSSSPFRWGPLNISLWTLHVVRDFFYHATLCHHHLFFPWSVPKSLTLLTPVSPHSSTLEETTILMSFPLKVFPSRKSKWTSASTLYYKPKIIWDRSST